MAFSGDAFCNSFKQELFEGAHDFQLSGGHDFKIALYDNTATLTISTTAYVTGGELANGNGYTTEGQSLTRIDPTLDTNTAIVDFADEVFSTATFTARGALIYNETDVGDAACVVLDFLADKTATAGDFTIIFPAAAAATAIIRIA